MTTEIKKLLTDLPESELEALLEQKRASKRQEEQRQKDAYNSLRRDTIYRLVPGASHIAKLLKNFNNEAFETMDAFFEVMCQHSQRAADSKGNFTIEEDNMRILYRRQEQGFFNELSAQAEKHIIDFVNSNFQDQPKTQKLITSLLERKKGKLDIKLVQKLYTMEDDFEDANWVTGIKLLKESWTPSATKAYIMFQVKNDAGQWDTINMNFSSI